MNEDLDLLEKQLEVNDERLKKLEEHKKLIRQEYDNDWPRKITWKIFLG